MEAGRVAMMRVVLNCSQLKGASHPQKWSLKPLLCADILLATTLPQLDLTPDQFKSFAHARSFLVSCFTYQTTAN